MYAYLKRIDFALALIAAVFAVVMMLHVAFDVFARNVLGTTLPATLELVSLYYMPALIFLPLAFVERGDEHIDVIFIYKMLPAWLRRLIAPLTLAIVATVYGAMGWVALQEALNKFRIGEFLMGTFPIPLWPGRFVVPIGFFAITVLVIAKLGLLLAGRRLKEQPNRYSTDGGHA